MRCFMKRVFSLLGLIVILLLLCSCNKGDDNMINKVSPSDKSLMELASTTYDNSQLLEIAQYKGSITELLAQYPIECIRKDNMGYRVSYLGYGKVATLIFDNLGNMIMGNIYYAEKYKSDFSVLQKGLSLEDVKKVHPNGDYPFLYTGRNDTPKVSLHYTEDGYLIMIEYDISNTIINIEEELI